MGRFVRSFGEIDRAQVAVVGGKGAGLGELARIPGITVPEGFCVTTEAFRRALAEIPAIDARLDRPEGIGAVSAEIRQLLEGVAIPLDIAAEIAEAVDGLCGEDCAVAVRSSATAEDLPSASFAGQQDSFLDVVGTPAILRHISRCWASLFNDRAVTYRMRNGFDHRKVAMAVIVQRMVPAKAAGVMFTADPVTSNRKVTSIEAVEGLGEALVAGLVTPAVYKVRNDQDVEGDGPILNREQILRLAEQGRRIEQHFGRPQDIEWCLDDNGEFVFVQSRPITTLFPIPETGGDRNHVWISVGHQQMMTDPMKPLGLSFWLLTTPAPMRQAAGRLFVDVTAILASPARRDGFLALMGRSDPLLRDAMETVLQRGDFIAPLPDDAPVPPPPPGTGPPAAIETDPAVVTEMIRRTQASLATVQSELETKTGTELVDFVLADFAELKRVLHDPQSREAIMAGMEAAWWLNEHLQEWLGDANAADVLTQSVPHNVTSEMGLALLDVADVIRPYPEVVAFLETVDSDDFVDELVKLPGGEEAHRAIASYLDRYGMRCVGEIDVTRPRWSERPATLLPVILYNIANFEPGAGPRRFEAGRRRAEQKEQELLQRLRTLPDGDQKADETKRMIDRVRTFAGFREYPKYGMISRYFVYKQALLEEAERLVRAGVLEAAEDIFFLSLQELRVVVSTSEIDEVLLRERKDAFRSYETLTPPRVLTSDGECIAGGYRRDDLPERALPGLAVSAGTVEGRARVVLDLAEAEIAPGDILVTAFTDPSWTPLFVAVAGLVTEVGGQMTHGAVIAREYGLPAVVGVQNATSLIRDGQRIRISGSDGYVELLD